MRFGFECTGESGGNSDENFWLWWLTDSGDFRVTTHARRTWGPNIIQVAFSASSSPGERVESAAWESYLELDFMRSVVVDHSIQYSRECLFRSWFLSGGGGFCVCFVLFCFAVYWAHSYAQAAYLRWCQDWGPSTSAPRSSVLSPSHLFRFFLLLSCLCQICGRTSHWWEWEDRQGSGAGFLKLSYILSSFFDVGKFHQGTRKSRPCSSLILLPANP